MSDDVVVRSDSLDRQLASSPVIRELTHLGRTNRRILVGLSVSILLDVVLTVALAIVAIHANDAANTASSAATQARLNCLAGNTTRADQLKLWTYVLSLPPPPGETPAARRRRLTAIGKFQVFIRKVFAPRDCDHLSAGRPGAFPTPSVVATSLSSATTTVPSTVAGGNSPAATPASAPASTPGPGPTPSRSPSRSPSPSPSPSSTCVRVVVTACLPPRVARA